MLSECDIVVDVGGVYDPALHRYDHHQRLKGEGLIVAMSPEGNVWVEILYYHQNLIFSCSFRRMARLLHHFYF